MASLPLFDRLDPVATPVWSVSELTALVREVLETGFAEVGLPGSRVTVKEAR